MTTIKSLLYFSLAFGMLASFTPSAFAQDRSVVEYNLPNGIGLKGFDPVAVFPEGGDQPAQGDAQFTLDYMGVKYFFASEMHRQMFMQNPAKYEPSYGGWCAYAMASNSKVDIQPQVYTIHGNRAHYFVGVRAKGNFDADVAGHEMRADEFWKQISGEEPRL